MVYLKRWSEFEAQATELYTKSPIGVRYCVKFRPKTGQLVLKLSDDLTCIKYKSHSSIVLNRFETLNTRLLSRMGNVRRPAAAAAAGVMGEGEREARAGTPAQGQGGEGDVLMDGGRGRTGTPGPGTEGKGQPGTPGGAGAGGGGGKKKKKGKK